MNVVLKVTIAIKKSKVFKNVIPVRGSLAGQISPQILYIILRFSERNIKLCKIYYENVIFKHRRQCRV